MPWRISIPSATPLGSCYHIASQLEEAERCYHEALEILPDTNNGLYRDIVSRTALLSYEQGGDPQTSLCILSGLLSQAKSELEYLSRCLTIGSVYYYENNYDSAWLYLNSVYLENKSVASRKQAAEWLVDICKHQGKNPELSLDHVQLSRLEAAVEQHFEGFCQILTNCYPTIKQDEMNQCLLCLLNLTDVQIAALLQCDYSTIKKRSAKLKKAFGTEKTLQIYLRAFVL